MRKQIRKKQSKFFNCLNELLFNFNFFLIFYCEFSNFDASIVRKKFAKTNIF